MDESRQAVAALTRAGDDSLPTMLRETVDELAARYDVKAVTSVDGSVEADGPMTEAFLRITAEAVRNAVRHGHASRVEVDLVAVPLSLTVRDDGCGFPVHLPGAGGTGGFGLVSMRQRAEGIGASLNVDSVPGEGTIVRVSWV